jgi:hypothetical protein
MWAWFRRDLGSLRELLSVGTSTSQPPVLTPWNGEPLDVVYDENNVSVVARRTWVDVTIGEGSDEHWIFRRDPSVVIP